MDVVVARGCPHSPLTCSRAGAYTMDKRENSKITWKKGQMGFTRFSNSGKNLNL